MTTRNQEIASVIINQIGGFSRVAAMLGVKQFVAIDNGVSFKIGGGAKGKINYIKIVLNGLDLYDLTFNRISVRKGEFDNKEVAVFTDIYCDQLKEIIEETTGMYLSI